MTRHPVLKHRAPALTACLLGQLQLQPWHVESVSLCCSGPSSARILIPALFMEIIAQGYECI